MKANFNIQKNVRNSLSFSLLCAMRKLQSLGLVALFLLIGSLQVWGDTAEWDFSSDGLSNTTKGQITMSYAQNSGTNPVAVLNNLLRLYRQSASPWNGCSVTFTAASGYQITAITVTFNDGRTSAQGKIDNGSYQNVFSGGNSKKVTISPLSATSYSIQNQATGKTTVTISSITVTYSSTCDKSVTISKGTESNCTFTLSKSGAQASCSGVATTVTVTPDMGYGTPVVTESGASAAPTITGSGTTWTVTYGSNTTGASTINVSCSANTTTVSFNQNSGTGGQTSEVTATYGQAMPTPIATPTREHYDFDGYYDGEGGTGNKYYNADGTSAATWNKDAATATLYAKWTEHGLTNYRTRCCEKKIAAPDVTATKTAYTITLSWAAVTSGNGNATAYEMQWNGGDWETVTSPVEKTSLTPNTSYTWNVRVKSWSGDYYCGAEETGEQTTTTNNVYTVTYNKGDGGSGTMTDANSPYEAGDEVTVLENSFTKGGWSFNGWSYSPSVAVEEGKFAMPAENVTITATWVTKKNYFIDRMHGNWDGEHTEPTTGYNCYVREGAGYTVPDLSDDGTGSNSCVTGHAKFIGWVVSSKVGAQGQLLSGYTIIKGGSSATAANDGTIYYAVWAEE